jgi:hypothetical protein
MVLTREQQLNKEQEVHCAHFELVFGILATGEGEFTPCLDMFEPAKISLAQMHIRDLPIVVETQEEYTKETDTMILLYKRIADAISGKTTCAFDGAELAVVEKISNNFLFTVVK